MACTGFAIVAATARAGAEPAHASSTTARTVTETAATREQVPVDRPVDHETTAADVAGAPVPGDESGRIDGGDGGDSLLRRGVRGILFVPKVAVDVALTPVRATVWAFDRYNLIDRYYRVFFNDDRTIGLIPTASYESGFGGNVGARFVDRDLFGAHEHLSLHAATGGQFRQIYHASLLTGDRLGRHVKLELDGQYELRPRDPFYGIGNNDDSSMPAAPVDPRVDPTAVETRYRGRVARAASVLDVRLSDGFHVRNSSELTDRTFMVSMDAKPIEAVYDPSVLVGYSGLRYAYSELELRFDNRHSTSPFETRSLYSTGSLAAVFAGRVHRLDAGSDYWRYGADLQHFIRLAEGPRVLAVRLHGEGVSGTLSEVPFIDLPHLGGSSFLRGYPTDRFRDRVAAFGSVDYEWDLSPEVSASLFVDAGRVFPSIGDLSLDRMRVGYGISLQGHTDRAFGLQGSLASSIDGGLFLNLSFNPVFDLDERVRRL